ncbi:hypothetical protein FHS96_003886 [Sphingomonas zeicaulis]|uniref:DUF7065 domain-containing protein n=1 Tax=Sphingomonas zeicaulis TaxID=1632740 RepID=UPI003D1BB16B
MTSLPAFTAADDCPHDPGAEASWQESALFVWHDREAGVGGFWRLGQEPVVQALNSCFALFTDDGTRFRSNVTGVPMAASDRGDRHMGWGNALRVELDSLQIAADFADCTATLRFEDFHPRYDYMALVKGPPMPDGTAHHFEVAGRMTGTVRLGDREIVVDALGYRDRSWGPRSWGSLRSTRWWPSVFGPDLSAHVLAVVTEGGQYLKFGYILRDGVPLAIVDSEILVTMESDALSPRGGTAHILLETGETLEIGCDRADGVAMHVRGYTAVECIGIARLGDRIGMSNLEVSTNATGGNRPPVLAIGANGVDGLSVRKSWSAPA